MAHQMHKEMSIGQLPAGAIFKIGLLCNMYLWSIFGLIIGLSAIAGYDTVSWNDEQVYGFGGMIVGFLIAAIFAVIGAVLLMLGGLIAGLMSRKFGGGAFTYIEHSDEAAEKVTAAE